MKKGGERFYLNPATSVRYIAFLNELCNITDTIPIFLKSKIRTTWGCVRRLTRYFSFIFTFVKRHAILNYYCNLISMSCQTISFFHFYDSALSTLILSFEYGIKTSEFYTRVFGGKLPINAFLLSVPYPFPCSGLITQSLNIRDTSVKALSCQSAEFYLSYI